MIISEKIRIIVHFHGVKMYIRCLETDLSILCWNIWTRRFTDSAMRRKRFWNRVMTDFVRKKKRGLRYCLHMEGMRSIFRSMEMHLNEAGLIMWRWDISTSRRLSSKGWRHMRGRWSRPIKMIPENMGLSGERSGAERRGFLLYRSQSGNICILR